MPTWNHPRIRGDTGLAHDAMRATSGSSPHTRGTPSQGRPAASAARDHPRIRGEHRYPHMMPALVGGIIPAYAGNTSRESCDRARRLGSSPHTRGTLPPTFPQPLYRRDHPRIRGEHVHQTVLDAVHDGIIPAYAGNTSMVAIALVMVLGSSPHTRGTRLFLAASMSLKGIIPAYTGNTGRVGEVRLHRTGSSPHTRGTQAAKSRGTPTTRDHPRIRGEHAASCKGGSRRRGIIPAYAGNTNHSGVQLATWTGSSPHTRGTRPWVTVDGESGGSSPHTRGTRFF